MAFKIVFVLHDYRIEFNIKVSEFSPRRLASLLISWEGQKKELNKLCYERLEESGMKFKTGF